MIIPFKFSMDFDTIKTIDFVDERGGRIITLGEFKAENALKLLKYPEKNSKSDPD